MQHLKKLNALCMGLAVAGLVTFAVAPAAIAHGAEDNGSTGGQGKANQAKVEDRIKTLRATGQEKLAERRAGHEAKTAERRQQICENRKTGINKKITAFSKAADTKLTQFNNVYTRVKEFKTDKQLEVSNYAELVAAADAQQTTATEAVAALKELSADFDCTKTDPAQTLAAIKASTTDAKTALKDYRTSIKNIVVALAQVNKSSTTGTDDQSGDNTGANDTTTTTTPTDTNTDTEAN
jgi:hypothetical protein